MVQLPSFADRYPGQLSGGQQQRIALARALIFEPKVVLMDEPLGALDKRLREQMQLDIRELHHRLGLTIMFVTHDQTEALTMSDRIAVFNAGKIEHIGPVLEVYDRPATRFVAGFIGDTNLIEGIVDGSAGDGSIVKLKEGVSIVVAHRRPLQERVLVSVRPDRLRLTAERLADNQIKARVINRIQHGNHVQFHLDADGLFLTSNIDRRNDVWKIGDEVLATFAPEECWVLAG